MKAKHTPGPWEAISAKDEHGDATISIRGSGEFIATMDLVSVDGGPYLLPKNGEANARLIAAAPDLLAECEELLTLVEDYAAICGDFPPAIKSARAAIAKARGEA